ncbi:hypothetical protein [Sphingobium herbicidovorans]|uniref:hypothetical protein n=1 Tax=Sphingobium herbicidovorans TaxID=76947 RepID=UPI001C3F90E9|nr:hypothetical protein [Sphingobium herbicidovorans]
MLTENESSVISVFAPEIVARGTDYDAPTYSVTEADRVGVHHSASAILVHGRVSAIIDQVRDVPIRLLNVICPRHSRAIFTHLLKKIVKINQGLCNHRRSNSRIHAAPKRLSSHELVNSTDGSRDGAGVHPSIFFGFAFARHTASRLADFVSSTARASLARGAA